MNWDFSGLFEFWPLVAQGFLITIAVSLCGLAGSMALGTIIALGRISRSRILRALSIAYIEFGRNIPFIVILFLVFFFLPAVGIRIPAFAVGVIALALHAGAYFAEIIRGAIRSVPTGQMLSAQAVGMTRAQAYRHVIFPQMMGYFLPAGINQVIMVVKESSILSTITLVELTMAGQVIMGHAYTPIETFFVISMLYWVVCTSISYAGQWLESALQPYLRERTKLPTALELEATHV